MVKKKRSAEELFNELLAETIAETAKSENNKVRVPNPNETFMKKLSVYHKFKLFLYGVFLYGTIALLWVSIIKFCITYLFGGR